MKTNAKINISTSTSDLQEELRRCKLQLTALLNEKLEKRNHLLESDKVTELKDFNESLTTKLDSIQEENDYLKVITSIDIVTLLYCMILYN